MIRGYEITRRLPFGVLKVQNDHTHTRDFVALVKQGERTLAIYGITFEDNAYTVFLRDTRLRGGFRRLSEAIGFIERHCQG